MDKEIVRRKFEEALEQCEDDFERFFLARLFGLQFSYGEDTCTVEVNVEEFMFNPQGTLHGGVIALILDVSMGHLCKKVLGTAATLEMKTQFLSSVRSGKVTCTASFLKQGQKIVALESKMKDEKGKLIAAGSATWIRL